MMCTVLESTIGLTGTPRCWNENVNCTNKIIILLGMKNRGKAKSEDQEPFLNYRPTCLLICLEIKNRCYETRVLEKRMLALKTELCIQNSSTSERISYVRIWVPEKNYHFLQIVDSMYTDLLLFDDHRTIALKFTLFHPNEDRFHPTRREYIFLPFSPLHLLGQIGKIIYRVRHFNFV